MSKLAEALPMDAVELRMKNAIQEGQATSVRSALPQGITIERSWKNVLGCRLAKNRQWMEKTSEEKNKDVFTGLGLQRFQERGILIRCPAKLLGDHRTIRRE